MRLEEHFESSSTMQRNERVKLAASFWNNVGAGMVIGGMAAAFFLDKPPGTWTKIGIAIAGHEVPASHSITSPMMRSSVFQPSGGRTTQNSTPLFTPSCFGAQT
jgi:hypothetical protein